MSNLNGSISENSNDRINLSNEDISTTVEPFKSRCSLNNTNKNNVHTMAIESLDNSLTAEQKVGEECTVKATNTSSNDLSKQDDLICTSNEAPSSNKTTPKRKNAKKKDKLKQLEINTQSNNVNTAQSIRPDVCYFGHSNVNSVNDYLSNQISLMYASTNSRYLENVFHHPNYQYSLNNVQPISSNLINTMSVPGTPTINSTHNQSEIMTSSPEVHSEPNTPRFIQNAMMHPILSHSFSLNAGASFRLLPSNVTHPDPLKTDESGKRKNKKCEKDPKDYKFDPYLSADEVNEGLNNNTLIEGVLRINPKQFQHSYIASYDRSEQDILIDGIKNRNRALEGDVIVVQIIDSDNEDNGTENKQKKGKVVYIKERVHSRTCIGTLKLMPDKNRQKALFTPRDHRIPRLNIPFISWPDNFYEDAKKYENTLFLAKILHWTDTRFALGKIVCLIGQSGDIKTETKAILAQNDLDITPYGPEVTHLYPGLDYQIPEEEINLREDCRKLCLFSIDPFNARDIDDAVSCRQLENGNFEIGVHISDVAHYLTENTILDDKVAEKATTIYLVDKAYHMLPDELCMLCSLFPGVDKLAFSVFWEITEDSQVINHRFSKTVIHSCCQLAYDHAQAILEDKENSQINFPETYNGYGYNDVYESIKTLGKIAATLRKNRFDNGALRIDQPKVSFHLDPTNGLPDSFWIYESKESHQLIEEFMLLANMTAANKIYSDHPKLAFLRCHPSPSDYMLKELAKALKPMGIDLKISSAGDLHKSLLPHVGPDSKDIGKAMVLNMLCAKPMTRAKYFCADGCDDDDLHHYALNVPLYTHFTSPIRRYADIMVHRLLAASLKYREVPQWEVNKVRLIAAQCNKQKYNAKKAGELSTELYTLKYIQMNSPLETSAVVVDVREKYIDVIIVCMGLNRRIFFNNDFPGTFKCIKNDGGVKLSKMEITWKAEDNLTEVQQVIEVFSILKVELHKGDEMVKVETKLKRPDVIEQQT